MIYIIYLLFILSIVQTYDYSITIDEKSSISQPIYRFSHSYELINNFQSNFNLTNNNQDLILTKIIDRDYWCSINICSCDYCSVKLELFSNNNNNQIPIFSTINITINDINDHTCQFFDLDTNISLSESIKINHRFPITRAIDYDSGNNGKLQFKLLNNQQYFQLDIVQLSFNEYAIYGIIKQIFDREKIRQYELIIEGKDFGFPQPKINQTKVFINILDENDNAPIFNQTEYSIQSLPENTPIGSQLLKVSASDADEGLNGLIHYSIINPPLTSSSFPFTINSTTGVISLNSSLDYETIHSYRFLIRASDYGYPQALFTDIWISISIKDINDSPPEILFIPNRRFQFNNRTLFIYENTEINNLILGYIRLVDRDSIQTKLSISFISLDEDFKQNYQIISSNQLNSYIFIVKQGIFDREIQNNIPIRFIVRDDLLTSIYDLNINLIDLNDNPPQFSSNPLKFYVEELANYQMVKYPIEDYQLTIGYLNATDIDQGENALSNYQLELNDLVKIDSNTGRLYLIQPLDKEQINYIQLKAKAINIQQPKWSTDVDIQIHVLDVNDNIPQCTTAYQRLSIPENYPIAKSLIKINGTDPDNDINGTISYSIRTNSTWSFDINKKTGEIFSKENFDYESEFKNFLLIIDLEDNGIPIKNQHKNACQIEIIVEDINDNRPELVNPNETNIFIDRNQINQYDSILLNITDKDSGLNGKLKYNFENIQSNPNLSTNQSLFNLHQNGSLEILYQISEISLFKLKILVEDYGVPSQQTLFEINIAFGDLFNSEYSSFEKIEKLFEEKNPKRNYFAFIFGLIILIITIIFLISIIIICLSIRKHHRRHKTAIISRNKLLCSSSQQLTTSNSTVISNLTEHQQIIRPPYWTDKSFIDQNSSVNSSSPVSDTYKILHIPVDMHCHEKDKIDNISCDHGYHESYQTGSPTSSSLSQSEQLSSQISIRRDYLYNQLPDFVTKCKTLSQGFIVEMNVDGSDEDGR